MPSRKKTTYEEKTAALETLVSNMESGGLTLEQMVKSYDEGEQLLAEMEKELAEAKRQITVLRRRGSEETEEPFQPEEDQ